MVMSSGWVVTNLVVDAHLASACFCCGFASSARTVHAVKVWPVWLIVVMTLVLESIATLLTYHYYERVIASSTATLLSLF